MEARGRHARLVRRCFCSFSAAISCSRWTPAGEETWQRRQLGRVDCDAARVAQWHAGLPLVVVPGCDADKNKMPPGSAERRGPTGTGRRRRARASGDVKNGSSSPSGLDKQGRLRGAQLSPQTLYPNGRFTSRAFVYGIRGEYGAARWWVAAEAQ
ncbi:hypothetical protein MRX96_010033 [Rhipicephalus microplus]